MEDLFWYLLNSLTNKVGMKATIGDVDVLGIIYSVLIRTKPMTIIRMIGKNCLKRSRIIIPHLDP